MLEVVRQKFHALPSSAQQQINESESFRVMFIEEVSKELDMSPDEIGGYLSIVVAASNQDLDSLLEMVSIGGVQEEGISQMAEADNNRQYIDWHNEMVLLPQAKALVVRAKMENGFSYTQAKDSINEEELRSVMQMLISKKRCFFPRPENVDKKDKKEKKEVDPEKKAMRDLIKKITSIVEGTANTYYMSPNCTTFKDCLAEIACNPDKNAEYVKLVGVDADVVYNDIYQFLNPSIMDLIITKADKLDSMDNFSFSSSDHAVNLFDLWQLL